MRSRVNSIGQAMLRCMWGHWKGNRLVTHVIDQGNLASQKHKPFTWWSHAHVEILGPYPGSMCSRALGVLLLAVEKAQAQQRGRPVPVAALRPAEGGSEGPQALVGQPQCQAHTACPLRPGGGLLQHHAGRQPSRLVIVHLPIPASHHVEISSKIDLAI